MTAYIPPLIPLKLIGLRTLSRSFQLSLDLDTGLQKMMSEIVDCTAKRTVFVTFLCTMAVAHVIWVHSKASKGTEVI